MSTILVKHISHLITNDPVIGTIKNASIFVQDNEIKQIGPADDLPKSADNGLSGVCKHASSFLSDAHQSSSWCNG